MKKVILFFLIMLFCLVSNSQSLENNYFALWTTAGQTGAAVYCNVANAADTSVATKYWATEVGSGTYFFPDLDPGVYDIYAERVVGVSGVTLEGEDVRLGHYYPIDGTVTSPKIASFAVTGDKLAEPVDSMSVLDLETWQTVADTLSMRAGSADSMDCIYVLKVPVIAGDPLYVEAGYIWVNTVLARLSYSPDGVVANIRRLVDDGP